MRFLIDAHLPRRMVSWLAAAGCDASHTLDLPLGNRTTDRQLTEIADRNGQILVTKDGDFVNSHMLNGQPAKLLLVSTGNISNRELEQLMVPMISQIVTDLQQHSFLELGQAGMIIRG